jgi:hypothetical protein
MKNNVCLALIVLVSACSNSSGGLSEPLDAAGLAVDGTSGGDGNSDAGLPTRGGSDASSAAPGCEQAAALCAKINQCAPFLVAAIYGDVATCTDRLTKVCSADATSAGSGTTQANIQSCKDSLTTATCNDVFANNLPACTFHGSLANGATCGSNSQCTSGLCEHGGQLCGACASQGSAGSPCPSSDNAECQSGLVCSPSKTCVVPATAGAACDDSTQPCLTGLFCTTAKTCGLTVVAGADCPGAYINFADGTVCLGKSTAANPQLPTQIATALVGEPCGLAPGTGLGPTLCAPGGFAGCTGVAGSIQLLGIPTQGQCAAPTPDNHTCKPSSTCLAGAQCIADTCQIPSGNDCQ